MEFFSYIFYMRNNFLKNLFSGKSINLDDTTISSGGESIVTINGQTYRGKNIKIQNGSVYVNGQDVTPNTKTITVIVNGDVETLSVDSCRTITVGGVTNNLTTVSGDVKVNGSIGGSVETVSGDVHASKIQGSVRTVSGDISSIYR